MVLYIDILRLCRWVLRLTGAFRPTKMKDISWPRKVGVLLITNATSYHRTMPSFLLILPNDLSTFIRKGEIKLKLNSLGTRALSFLRNVPTGSGTHQAFYSVITEALPQRTLVRASG